MVCPICGCKTFFMAKESEIASFNNQCAKPPPIPRCLGCRDRYGVASYQYGDDGDRAWVYTKHPMHFFGEDAVFQDTECPECKAEKRKLKSWTPSTRS